MVMKKGTQVITLRVSEETKLRIEMEATRQGRSVNNFLQYIIEEYLKGEKNKGEHLFATPYRFINLLFLR